MTADGPTGPSWWWRALGPDVSFRGPMGTLVREKPPAREARPSLVTYLADHDRHLTRGLGRCEGPLAATASWQPPRSCGSWVMKSTTTGTRFGA